MVGWNVFGNMWNEFSEKSTVPEALNPPQFDPPWNFRMFAAVERTEKAVGESRAAVVEAGMAVLDRQTTIPAD